MPNTQLKSIASLFFLAIFGLATGIEMGADLFNISYIHFLSKPLLLLSLILYFYLETVAVQNTIRNIFFVALFFGWIGDIILLFQNDSPQYFMFGLIAFLIGHVVYIWVFAQDRAPSFLQNVVRKQPFIFAATVLLAVVLLNLLWPKLGAMLVPVVVYALVLMLMALSAANRLGQVSQQSYNWVIIGAFFFMISDGSLPSSA